ncbi:MAG TPA: phosphoribosylformylglycinamidine cyclo-ligase [Gammaproteobacteria bacterium]|nr:phosphoribosylformylglycinamidine cyclo-ligase [Gammaproteobacteria bacterium]
MSNLKNSQITYEDAGVSIKTGNELVTRIKPIATKTHRPGVLAGLGGFGALFELPLHRYQQPILVSSTDGVGTKLKLALALNKHDTIGIDLVAMCVNDIIVQGAEPLFFLDYFATSRLDLAIATEVIRGIGQGCEQAGAALVGGETAEMPGMYQHGDYDLAGFAVGIVEKNALLDGTKVRAGDAVIGIASSGVHANGFSLIRKILEQTHSDLHMPFAQSTLGETLLQPTRIYVKPILQLLKQVEVHAIAHITGGGLLENLPRVLPPYTQARLNASSWPLPEIFHWIQTQAQIEAAEMYRTFNCGIGMTLVVPAHAIETSLQLLQLAGETACVIGTIETSQSSLPEVIIA